VEERLVPSLVRLVTPMFFISFNPKIFHFFSGRALPQHPRNLARALPFSFSGGKK
jgi:hypothetical protein